MDVRGAKRAVAHYVSDLSGETKKKLRHEDSLKEPAAEEAE